MTALQWVISRSMKGYVFSDKILILILVEEILFYTDKSPLVAPFIQ